MKKIIFFTITLLLFIIQSVILIRLPIFGVTIPLIFIFGLTISIFEDKWEALYMGLFTGFLIDIYTSQLFGINMILNMWFFVLANKLASYLRRENKILMSVFMALITLLRYFSEFIISKIFSDNFSLINVGVVSLMTLFVSFITLWLYKKIIKSRYFKKHID